jgi:hypothetical protein
MTDFVLTSLGKRRAELIAEAKTADTTLRRLLDDIAHIDGAIRTYDPTYRPRKIKLARAQYVGTMRAALTILRGTNAPMTLRDIAVRVIAEQGRDQGDAKLIREMIERVRTALLRQRRNGVVVAEQEPGQVQVWRVVH